jgi:prophage regulatory protein
MQSLMRLSTVMQRTGLGRTTLYMMVNKGEFPRQINIGPRAVGWVSQEVEDWILQRIAAGRIAMQSAQSQAEGCR